MDWPTAWKGMVPVYAVAVISHAFFALFSVPFWVIFLVYAYKVLNAARFAEDPWQGHASPKPYLYVLPAALFADLGAFAVLPFTSSVNALLAAIAGSVAALCLAALFVAGSAPPGVRERRRWVRLGLGSEILAALAAPAILLGLVSLDPATQSWSFVIVPMFFAGLSSVAFLRAGRLGERAAGGVARKAPRS